MKHLIKLRKLNRTSSHRKSIFYNLCNSLIKYEFIKTTLFKAKEIRKFLEPLITIGKIFSNFNIKQLFNKLRNIDCVLKLFKIISPRYKFRNGGYIRIYKCGFRKGDNADLAFLKFL